MSMKAEMSSFQLETLISSSMLNACVITSPGDIYTVESGNVLKRYTFSGTRKITCLGSLSFKTQVHSFVVYPEVNLILAHVDRAIHAINIETMASQELTSLPNVTALVPHCCGYEPVYIRFPDVTHTEIIDLSQRSLYYVPISTNPALTQRALSASKRPCLNTSRHGLFDFIVIQEGGDLGSSTSMSVVLCTSKEPVAAFPLPISSLQYQTSTVSFVDNKVLSTRKNINPHEFSYEPAAEHLSRFNIMLLDIGQTLNSYAWIGEYLFFAQRNMLAKKLQVMSMDIRKLVYLTTFTSMLHDASFSTPTSLDKIGVPKDKNLKYLGELVLSVVVDTPLLDMMTPDYALFTLEKPTYVDSALKKQLLHEIYLRLCAGEKMDRNFCNRYDAGTVMYSYGWTDNGHASHEALRADATEKGTPVEKIVRRMNLSFLDDRDTHNRILKGIPSERSLKDPVVEAAGGALHRVDSKDTYSGNTTIKAISQYPRLCFNLLRDANNLKKDSSVFTGNIIDLERKGKPPENSNVVTSKGPELFVCVQALSKAARHGLLRCPARLLESDLKYVSASMAEAVRKALQFSGTEAGSHEHESQPEIADDLDHELSMHVQQNKYCGAYIPLPYILRVKLGEKNKPYTYVDTDKCAEETSPSIWNYYNMLYGKEPSTSIIATDKLYRLAIGLQDFLPESTKSLVLQQIISSEEPLKSFVEETTESVSVLQLKQPPVPERKYMVKGILPAFITGNSHIFGLTNMFMGMPNCLPCDTTVFYIHTNMSLIAIKRTPLYREIRASLLDVNKDTYTTGSLSKLLNYVEGKLEKTLVERFDMSSRDWCLCWVLTGSLRLLQRNFWGAILAFLNARMVNPLQIVGILLHGISLEHISLLKNTPARKNQPSQSYMDDVNFGCYSQRIRQILSSEQYAHNADKDGRVRYNKSQGSFYINSLMDDMCKVMNALGISGEQDYVDLPPELEITNISERFNLSCDPASDEDVVSRLDACLLYLKLILDPYDSWNLILHGVLSKVDAQHETTKDALVGKVSMFRPHSKETHIAETIRKGSAHILTTDQSNSEVKKRVSDASSTIVETYRISKLTAVDHHNIFPLRALFIMLLSRETYHISRPQQRLFLLAQPTNSIGSQACFLSPAQYSNIFLSTIGLLVLGRFYDLAYVSLETYVGWMSFKANGNKYILGREWSAWMNVGTGENKKPATGPLKTVNSVALDQIYPGLATDAAIEALANTYKSITFEASDFPIINEYTKTLLAVLAISHMHVSKYSMSLLYKTVLFFILALKNTSISNFLCGNLAHLSIGHSDYCSCVLKLVEKTPGDDLFNALLDIQINSSKSALSFKQPEKETIERFVSTVSIATLQKYLSKTEAKRTAPYVNILLQIVVCGAQHAMLTKNSTPSAVSAITETYLSSDAMTFLLQHVGMFQPRSPVETNDVEVTQIIMKKLKQLSGLNPAFDGPYLLTCIKLQETASAINTLYEKAFPGISVFLDPLLKVDVTDNKRKTTQDSSSATTQLSAPKSNYPVLNRSAFNSLILWCITASRAPCMAVGIMQDPAYVSGTAKFDELWNSDRIQANLDMVTREDCIAFLMTRSEITKDRGNLPGYPSRSPAALLYEVLRRLDICYSNNLIRKADFSYCLMSLLNDNRTGGCGPRPYIAKYLYKDILNLIPRDYPLNFILPFIMNSIEYCVVEQTEVEIGSMSISMKLAQKEREVDKYRQARMDISSFTKCYKCKGLVDPGNATKLSIKYVDGDLRCFHTECAT